MRGFAAGGLNSAIILRKELLSKRLIDVEGQTPLLSE